MEHNREPRTEPMIQIKELGPEHVGKWVEYRGGAGELERGRIKSWNDRVVFVVYHRNGEWHRFKEFTCFCHAGIAFGLALLGWLAGEKRVRDPVLRLFCRAANSSSRSFFFRECAQRNRQVPRAMLKHFLCIVFS